MDNELSKSKTLILDDEDFDLQNIDMQEILSKAIQKLPADFIIIDISISIPLINLKITNEFSQDLILMQIENFSIQSKKAAGSYFYISVIL